MKKCLSCGANLVDEAVFCTQCGTTCEEIDINVGAEPTTLLEDESTTLLVEEPDEESTALLEDDEATTVLDEDSEAEVNLETSDLEPDSNVDSDDKKAQQDYSGIEEDVKYKESPDSNISERIKETVPTAAKVILGLVSLSGVILNIITAVLSGFYYNLFDKLGLYFLRIIILISTLFFLINSIILFKAKSKNAIIVSYILADILYLGLSIAALVLVLN